MREGKRLQVALSCVLSHYLTYYFFSSALEFELLWNRDCFSFIFDFLGVHTGQNIVNALYAL